MLGNRRAISVFQEDSIEQRVALEQLPSNVDKAEDVNEPMSAPEGNMRMEELMRIPIRIKNAKETSYEKSTLN